MGFREEELKAKGQKARVDVDLLKHNIVKGTFIYISPEIK